MTYHDRLLTNERAPIADLLTCMNLTEGAERDQFKARVAAVMESQGLAVLAWGGRAYIRTGDSLLVLPCPSPAMVQNEVRGHELTAEQVRGIFEAGDDGPGDMAIAEAAGFAAHEDADDGYASVLPLRTTRPRSEVMTSILAQTRAAADQDTKEFVPANGR